MPLDISAAVLGAIEKQRQKIEQKLKGKKNPGKRRRNSTSTEVRSPTSTSTEVRSPTKTSTEAYTSGNFTATVTGGAGAGATTSVTIKPNRGNRRNPILPLDLYSAMMLPQILTGINKERLKIARSGSKKKNAKRGKRVKVNPRRNPLDASRQVYEGFHGHQSKDSVTIRTPIHEHKYLAGLGELRKLTIVTKKYRVKVKFSKPYPILSTNEKRTQLFIEGGDQSVNLADFGIRSPHEKEVLGHLTDIYYFTTKDHLDPRDGGKAVYHHKYGKNKPTMVYDSRNKLIEFAGGGYSIPDEGIDG